MALLGTVGAVKCGGSPKFNVNLPKINENDTGKENRYVYTSVHIPEVGKELERYAIVNIICLTKKS